jgi:hypothetical protein
MDRLTDGDWELLLTNIKDGNCTPFLGAGACYGTLPLGADIAREWAEQFHYPFDDKHDLVRVASYVAIQTDPQHPKKLLLNRFKNISPPEFNQVDEPHRVLADLPLPVYLTTNYDDFLVRALVARQKAPEREMCRWNHLIRSVPSIFKTKPGYKPHAATPLVFHLHGHSDSAAIVLTEDDYLCFLASMVRNWKRLLPSSVQEALDRNALLFIGYRAADWNFRVLLQALRPTSERRSYIVIPPPSGPGPTQKEMQTYLEEYYKQMSLRVCWDTARGFCGELRKRWREANPE